MAFNGSAGHGAFLVCQIKKPLIISNEPESINNNILYLESTIKKGKLVTIPARIAPAPNATNKEGKAQQRSVPKLVNKLREGIIRFFDEIGFTFKCFYYVSTVYPASSKILEMVLSLISVFSCK